MGRARTGPAEPAGSPVTLAAAEPITARERTWQAVRTLSAALTAGALLGFLIGGVGGRLAMRALFLTSGPSVRGLISDDGFPIGRFDVVATLNLLLVGTVLGIIGAFVYLLVRPFLLGPRWLRRVGCSAGAGAVVGAMIIHTDGVDFTVLGPRWFAIALFVAIPATYGWFIPAVVARMSHPEGWFQTAPERLVLLPLLPLCFPPLFVLLVVPAAVVVGARHAVLRRPTLARAAASPFAMWSVRTAWLGAALLGVAALSHDAVTLLTGQP